MAEFKLTKAKLNEGWESAYERLFRSWKFQSILHSDKPEDGLEGIWMYGQTMRSILTEEAFAELLEANNDDIYDAWEDLLGKLKDYTASKKDD